MLKCKNFTAKYTAGVGWCKNGQSMPSLPGEYFTYYKLFEYLNEIVNMDPDMDLVISQ